MTVTAMKSSSNSNNFINGNNNNSGYSSLNRRVQNAVNIGYFTVQKPAKTKTVSLNRSFSNIIKSENFNLISKASEPVNASDKVKKLKSGLKDKSELKTTQKSQTNSQVRTNRPVQDSKCEDKRTKDVQKESRTKADTNNRNIKKQK